MYRRRSLMGQDSEPPFIEGFRQLTCLTSSGHQAMSSNLIFDNSFRFDIEFVSSLNQNSSNYVYGVLETSTWLQNFALRHHTRSGSGCEMRAIFTDQTIGTTYNSNNSIYRAEICIDERCNCNTICGSNSNTFRPTSRYVTPATIPFGLFAANTNAGLKYMSSMSLYSFTVYNGFTEISKQFVPALRKEDSKPGLLNILNPDEFLTNELTGEFGYTKLSGSVIAPV